MQAERGKEMGLRFAEMILPDRDQSDISLRVRSARQCFSDLHVRFSRRFANVQKRTPLVSLMSSELCCHV